MWTYFAAFCTFLITVCEYTFMNISAVLWHPTHMLLGDSIQESAIDNPVPLHELTSESP